MFHNILVVIDGSTDAELALTHAITLAEYSDSQLTLFTAVEQPPPAAYWGLAAPGMIGFVERAEARAPAGGLGADDHYRDSRVAQHVITDAAPHR